MRLLFDENLSYKLPRRLAELYPGSVHLSDESLLHAPDTSIWDHARVNEFVIVTADADFLELAVQGPPPKVIWLRRWDHPTRDAEALLRREAVRITEFAADAELAILILEKR